VAILCGIREARRGLLGQLGGFFQFRWQARLVGKIVVRAVDHTHRALTGDGGDDPNPDA
jgi:hypothetical protein